MNAEYMVQMWNDSAECGRVGRYAFGTGHIQLPDKLKINDPLCCYQAGMHP